jgi:hypothetical protein
MEGGMLVGLVMDQLTRIGKETPVSYWPAIFLEKFETSHKNATSLCVSVVMVAYEVRTS